MLDLNNINILQQHDNLQGNTNWWLL